jgi:hypothetical protein
MSFAFNLEIQYPEEAGPSLQEIGAIVADPDWQHIVESIASLEFLPPYGLLKLTFWETDNEQFLADWVKFTFVEAENLPPIQDIKWDGLDLYLSEREDEPSKRDIFRRETKEGEK